MSVYQVWQWTTSASIVSLAIASEPLERVEHAGKARVGVLLGVGPARIASDREVRLVAPLVAEAAHLDSDALGQRPAQILDVDAGAAVDVRRVLVGQQRRLP